MARRCSLQRSAAGLAVVDRSLGRPGPESLVEALTETHGVDVVNITTPVDPSARRVLFRGVDAVLANSSFEPFGLVGLETMAVGGIATTGCTGEDYALAGRNSLVLQTDDPREFIALYRRLREDPAEIDAMRKAGRATARQFAWAEVVHRNLLPRLELSTIRDVTFAHLLEASAAKSLKDPTVPTPRSREQVGASGYSASERSAALVARTDRD